MVEGIMFVVKFSTEADLRQFTTICEKNEQHIANTEITTKEEDDSSNDDDDDDDDDDVEYIEIKSIHKTPCKTPSPSYM